jgi:hypothetical protein
MQPLAHGHVQGARDRDVALFAIEGLAVQAEAAVVWSAATCRQVNEVESCRRPTSLPLSVRRLPSTTRPRSTPR